MYMHAHELGVTGKHERVAPPVGCCAQAIEIDIAHDETNAVLVTTTGVCNVNGGTRRRRGVIHHGLASQHPSQPFEQRHEPRRTCVDDAGRAELLELIGRLCQRSPRASERGRHTLLKSLAVRSIRERLRDGQHRALDRFGHGAVGGSRPVQQRLRQRLPLAELAGCCTDHAGEDGAAIATGTEQRRVSDRACGIDRITPKALDDGVDCMEQVRPGITVGDGKDVDSIQLRRFGCEPHAGP